MRPNLADRWAIVAGSIDTRGSCAKRSGRASAGRGRGFLIAAVRRRGSLATATGCIRLGLAEQRQYRLFRLGRQAERVDRQLLPCLQGQ